MPTAHKVAIVTHGGIAYVHRLILGAMSCAGGATPISTRDFRLEEDVSADPGADLAELNRLRNWSPDGLLCALGGSASLEQLVQALSPPRPVVNMFAAKPMPGVVVVIASFPALVEKGLQHLRQQGLRSTAYLDTDNDSKHEFRRGVFEQIARPADPAMASFFEAVKPALLTDPSAAVVPVPARLAAWLRQLPKPVGVLCSVTGGGGYLIRVCHELGLRVPADVAVVGADDSDLALAVAPTLTTVLPDAQAVGAAAMKLLCDWMNGKPVPSGLVRVGTVHLHVRESTGRQQVEVCDIPAALEYVARHACHGLSVERLLLETQRVCKKTFYTHFQAITGQTPGDAIEQRQVAEARRLLTQTQISVTAVAEYCGFGDSSNFARAFRAAEGKSPMEYRMEKQKAGSRKQK